MGLDQYIYKAKKPIMDSERIYTELDINIYNYLVLTEDDIRNPRYRELKNHCLLITYKAFNWDFESIAADYNLDPDSVRLVSINENGFTFEDKTCFEVTVSCENINKYSDPEIMTVYITALEEVVYRRNDRKLSKFMYKELYTENGGYHCVGRKVLSDWGGRIGSLSVENIPHENSPYFYYEWY